MDVTIVLPQSSIDKLGKASQLETFVIQHPVTSPWYLEDGDGLCAGREASMIVCATRGPRKVAPGHVTQRGRCEVTVANLVGGHRAGAFPSEI